MTLHEYLSDAILEGIDAVHDMDVTHDQYAWSAADKVIAALASMGYVPAADVEAAVRKEREACAETCVDHRYGHPHGFLDSCNLRRGHRADIAAAIRARRSQEGQT